MLHVSDPARGLRKIPRNLRRARALRDCVGLEPLETRTLLTAAYSLLFTSNTLHAETVTGIAATGTAKLSLTNTSDAAPLSSDKLDIHIYARPIGALNADGDKEVGKLLNQSTNFKEGTTKSLSVSLSIPLTVAAGSYELIAIATRPIVAGVPAAEVTEVQGANLTVDPQILDMAGQLLTVKMPATLTSGTTTSSTATIKVTNAGNVPFPKGSFGAVNVEAISDADPNLTFFLFGEAGVSISGMKPGATSTKTFTFTFPISVPTGTYHILGLALHNPIFVDNGNVPNSSALLAPTINVTQGVIDLSTTVTTSAPFPAIFVSGFTAPIKFTANVFNSGSLPTASNETAIFITLLARPVAGGSDIQLDQLIGQSIAKLAPGKSKPFTFTVNPSFFGLGEFNIVATVSDASLDDDLNQSNNESTSAHSITVVDPVVDTTANSATTTLTGSVAGFKTGSVVVTIGNLGNVPAAGYTVELFATKNGAITSSSLSVGKLTTTGSVAANGTTKATVSVKLPGPAVSTTYTLVARITPTHDEDINTNNNTLTVGPVTVLPIPLDNLLGNVPSAITLTQIGVSTSDGEVTGNNGTAIGVGPNTLTGTYFNLVVLQASQLHNAQLGLTFIDNLSHTLVLSYTSIPSIVGLDGLTIIFSKSSTGSIGKFTTTADAGWGLDKTVTGYFRFA